MIKAYHGVGSDGWSAEELSAALHEVLNMQEILPASSRFARSEMKKECFSGKETSVITKQFGRITPKARAAILEMVNEKLGKLPEDGQSQSLFNCVDFLAGDLDYVFLRPGDWYSVDNGFVFDAADLFRKGARFRPRDLLGAYASAIKIVASQAYRTVREARLEIEAMIDLVKGDMEYRGIEALEVVKACLEGGGVCAGQESPMSEIVFPGPLPTGMAIEVWENGVRLYP